MVARATCPMQEDCVQYVWVVVASSTSCLIVVYGVRLPQVLHLVLGGQLAGLVDPWACVISTSQKYL